MSASTGLFPTTPLVTDVTFQCQTETPQIKEQLKRCKDVFLQGSNSEFCSFVNSTLVNLETMCAGDRAVSLQDVARPFGSFLNSSILSAGGKENEGEVASAVTFLLQSVELAALTAALRSPKNTSQTVTTESMAIETLHVELAAGPCDKVFTLRAQEQAMDIHCDTVTRAATEDSWAVAFISYSTLGSIINKRFFNEGDLTADEKLRNCHLNSRVVSGAVGNGSLMNISKPVNFTLRHRQAKKEEEETRCGHWKFIAGKGTWAEDGCTILHTNSTHTICSCDHLSSFALLMGLSGVEENRVQVWVLRFKKDEDKLYRVQRRATEMIRGLENMTCEKRLKELSMFCPETRRLMEDMIIICKYAKGRYKEDCDQLVPMSTKGRTRRNWLNEQPGRFRLDIRKNFLSLRMVQHRNR
ncbi:adhesion G protein-coupled receptor E3-like [Mauremys reevesii]|uniref:adhesion G protein-coupled receptor E3-like n=1 Tax=Mauremys reevesii TaxID=260615 RepID=UPI00193EE9D4|nr:adhesion G protein-coupled receptor E3-like [Mauremys reevesii]